MATPVTTNPQRGVDHGWSRAGAHNIAGVSFQIAVTARLLAGALTGGLPLTRATPEGFEDIDVELRDGARVLVQVKDRSPSAHFGHSHLADAIRQKKTLLTNDASRRFTLVTNAALGGGLSPTGWSLTVTEGLDPAVVDRLAKHLVPDFSDPAGVLARTHVVHMQWSVVERTRLELAEIVGSEPSIAALVYARLIERITDVAVRQRSATPDTAQSITPSDLEALATRVLESVDVESLHEAVRMGIVEPVDFGAPANLTVHEFLAGVDVMPAHVAADLDLPRPREIQALTDALGEQQSALLTGPSGSGKSALMWRAAKTLSGRTRPYRLLRLLPEDVPPLARWLRLQHPSEHYPLLLCADNLGRPASAGWTEIAREFSGMPGVLLLGACREEDYRPELAVGRTMIVDPTLDRELADGIATALSDRGVETVVDTAEAFENSDGLLMEFLSMLLTGRRLKQVVEEQVAARLAEDRRTEREILRYVTTAHSAGVAIPAETLELLIPETDLVSALAVLDREHLVIAEGGNRWMGLHELRSAVARDYLHQFPPPATTSTLRRLVENLPVEDACRIIEEYARLDADLVPMAEAVSDILHSPDTRASDCAQLVASLAMADAFRHARACLQIVEAQRSRNLDPWTALFLAYSRRFGGVSFDSLVEIGPGFAQLTELAAVLPPRPASLRDRCLLDLSPHEVGNIALRGTVNEAVAWLESLEDSDAGQVAAAEQIWTHFDGAPLDASARLAATLRTLAPTEDAERLGEVLGSLHERTQRLAAEVPDCIGAATKYEQDGRVVSLSLLVPADDATLHDQSVQTCRVILDLCPEADIAEVTVFTPDRDRFAIGDFEEGYKRIPRGIPQRVPQTSGNANVLRAARILLASHYWTQPLRALAEASQNLLALEDSAVRWLIDPHHNNRRRREAARHVDSLVAKLAAQPGEPVGHDDSRGDSKASDAMQEALAALRDLAVIGPLADQQWLAHAARCREAVKRLRAARLADLPRLSTVGEPLPEALDEMLTLLADLLFMYAEGHRSTSKPARRRGSETWPDVARRLVRESASDGYEDECETLEKALGTPDSWELRRVGHTGIGSTRLLTDWWVIIIAAESDVPAPLEFADRLSPELAPQLAFRTFAVFESGRRILPLGALKLGTSQFWPANEEELVTIASGLGTEVLESVHLQELDAFVTELIRASRAAALLRLRAEVGLIGNEQAFEAQYRSACKAAAACLPVLHDEATRLLERVEREPSSDRRTLAGEAYRSVTHGETSEDLDVLNELRIAALSTDLNGS